MGVDERLSLEAVNAHTLIAVEHRHRYAWARSACAGKRVLDLCCGTGYGSAILAEVATSVVGVDRDAAAVDTAQAHLGAPGLEFVTADALDHLRRVEPEEVDVVVCFEGLEHLPDVEAVVGQLARLVDGGVALLASAPNSATFEEENEFHLTDFDLRSFRRLFDAIPGAVIAYQSHAEGSLIRGRSAGEVSATVQLSGEQDLDWANHFLVLAGLDAEALLDTADANLQLAVAPVSHRYMRHLEQANRALLATNARLGRERLGLGVGGAGSAVMRREEAARVLEEECARRSSASAMSSSAGARSSSGCTRSSGASGSRSSSCATGSTCTATRSRCSASSSPPPRRRPARWRPRGAGPSSSRPSATACGPSATRTAGPGWPSAAPA